MVFHKGLDYGTPRHQVPPRVPSSARGKRSARRRIEDKQMCAFDLLATVAEELLSGRESTLLQNNTGGTSSPVISKGAVKEERIGDEKPPKAEIFDQGSCNESTKEPYLKKNESTKECSLSPRAMGKDATGSVVVSKMGESNTPNRNRSIGLKALCKLEDGMKTPLQAERRTIDNVAVGNVKEILEDPMDVDAKPPALVSSDSSVEISVPRKSSFVKRGNEISVDGDDDENSSGCTHPKLNTSKAYRPQHVGDRRIRKLFSSNCWKVAPKDRDLPNAEMKAIYRNRKLCYTRQRTQRSSFKRRKLLDRRSISATDLDIYGEGVLPKLGCVKMEASSDTNASLHADGASSSTSDQKSSYGSGDYHVKLNIKSFKVPELFIEVPENATVGSLKRTVMEAVTAILGGGLRVGVLHQGKKVRDDNKTLLQAGISHNDETDNLGFMLEPSSTPIPLSLLCPEDPNFIAPTDATEELKIIPAPPPTLELPEVSEVTPVTPCPESDHDSVHSPVGKPLVPVLSMSAEASPAVPLRKPKRAGLAQRRIRRPFSVSEVEALVQAVEKLGTGRWRDVKLRAFDNAKHRTYVDLKDKWKTLVHTARISPQQRRGEPVPQDLLDRVLSAHAYWSAQQAKPPPAEAGLLG